ncbi:hypothetical protein Tco_1451018 [Tanacetum coccineum]
MHGQGHPELAKKLNDKIPKTMDDTFERVRAFIRGEVAAGSAKVDIAPLWEKGNIHTGWSRSQERVRGWSGSREFRRSIGTCAPYARRETFTPLIKTLKEILAMESVNFSPPTVDRNSGEHIEEVVASEKLAHLVKDIRQGNKKNRVQGQGNVKVINMVGLGGNRKRPYETEEPRVMEEIAFPAIPQNSLTDVSIILEGTIEGFRV